jgi:hypothetical protein
MSRLDRFRSQLGEQFLEASVRHPSDYWYVLVDAAQYPYTESLDWAKEAQYGHWGNLLLANPEGQEADLTAWLAPLSGGPEGIALPAWLDLEACPFATTWIQSPYTLYQVTYHWQRLVDAHLPNKKVGMLRFYDGCALQHMMQVLDEDQWNTLSAPVRRWIYCDRTGDLQTMQREPAAALASFPLELTAGQVDALKSATHVDRIILDLRVAEWLAPDADPFDAYAQISERVRIAKAHSICDLPRQFQLAATTLHWNQDWLRSDELDQRLSSIGAAEDAVIDALADLQEAFQNNEQQAQEGR